MKPNWDNLNSLSKTGLSTRLNFGQYFGELVSDIVEWDAKYIIFLFRNGRIEPNAELLEQILNTINEEKHEY